MIVRRAKPPVSPARVAPTFAVLASAALVIAGGALAQTTKAAAPAAAAASALPRLFAGYSQAAIPAAACRLVSAGEVDCQTPGMIAGRYVIQAAGTSTAQGAGAVQVLQIVVGDQVCGVGRNTAAWSSGSRTFRMDCATTLVSDRPVSIRVLYADEKAVKDPKGPVVTIQPLAWNGVLSTLPFAPKQ
jgi:hypothetical protein